MNLNIEKKTEINKITKFIIFSIEHTNKIPYIYFHMIKNENTIKLPSIYIKSIKDCNIFMDTNFKLIEYKYIGTIQHNDENVVIYELFIIDQGILNTTYSDTWWKVLPYEILYTQMVIHFNIDQDCILFFKNNPQLLFLFNDDKKYETPVVAYIGIDYEDINHQILLSDLNHKMGYFGKGYYFLTPEEAYFRSLYNDLTTVNNILKIPNNNYINYNTPIDNINITVQDNKFYLNNFYIGTVPKNCLSNKYKLYKFNTNYIFLQTDTKIKTCTYSKDHFIKKNNEGHILRYVLFLKKNSYLKKRGYDSYFYFKNKPLWFPYYMVKNDSQFSLISYHTSKEQNIDINYMFNKNKNLSILIK